MESANALILAIDTTSRRGSVAVAREGRVVALLGVEGESQQSAVLWSDVDMLLRRVGATLRDVTAFGVARGPGAFTGVRVGIAAAAGLSRATGAPLYGATSLELAARAARLGDPVWVVLNAYRNEVYAQRFVVDAARRVVALTEPVVEAPAALFARLDDGPLRLTGSGVDAYSAELAEEARTRGAACRWSIVPAPAFVAGELAELVAERAAAKLLPDRVTPCYVRQSEAEINLKAGRLESAGAPRVV